ncbi:hypothetical protein QUB47_07740 [Microcoleus sp. AT9_B5]
MANKVKYGDKVGIDLDQVIAWKYLPGTIKDPSPNLKLFIFGESLIITQQEVGEADFTELHTHLIEAFNDEGVSTSGVGTYRIS